jgi:hydroxyacylglutathione hydrolase
MNTPANPAQTAPSANLAPATTQPIVVIGIPAFDDNYFWLIHNGVHAAVVDPGDAAPVLAVLEKLHLTLVAILLTHHHPDHTGGVAQLSRHTPVPVFGPRKEAITGITCALDGGTTAHVETLNLTLSVIDVPGHTAGHIAYYAAGQQWLFCGDTLFAGGCGRLFEGTPAQMLASLSALAALPDATQVFCAHEYTLANLRFASAVEPHNPALQARVTVEEAKRAQGLPTVPSTIGLEKATNPFLRSSQPAIIASLVQAGRLPDQPDASQEDAVAAFGALREWKNTFR